MDDTTRESRINKAFVVLADTLTSEFDIVELLHTLVEQCTQILDTDAGGLMLVDDAGSLQLMTSTSEAADFVEVMALNANSGPCIDCFVTGKVVSVRDVEKSPGKWPEFEKAAVQGGYRSAHAIPLRLRGEIIGALNLFAQHAGEFSARDAELGQALADVATIGILQERLLREQTIISEQLHHALDSRIVIEQAKGLLAHSLSLTMDEAFAVLRAHARSHNLTLRFVAEGISNRAISPEAIRAPSAIRDTSQHL